MAADRRAHDAAEEALVAAQLRELDDVGLRSVDLALSRHWEAHPRKDREQLVFAMLMLHRERQRRERAKAKSAAKEGQG